MAEGSNADLSPQGAMSDVLTKLEEQAVLDLENLLGQFAAGMNDLNRRVTALEEKPCSCSASCSDTPSEPEPST